MGAGPEDHIQVDLADHADTARAIAEIRKRLDVGELQALVNNAAISPKAADGSRLGTVDTDIDMWSHVFRVNFFAPIMMARGLIEELKAAKGSVVNVTSIAGSRVHPFAGVAYATSKAALASLTREMASDFGRVGVRVNSIAPGEIDTSICLQAREDCRSTDPATSARDAGRGRQDHLCAVQRDEFLRQRRRDPYQWRPARIAADLILRVTHPSRHLRLIWTRSVCVCGLNAIVNPQTTGAMRQC